MNTELTPKDEAMRLHAEIGMCISQINTSIYTMGRVMTMMKDRELYKELGYESFDGYCQQEWGLKHSQSAKFISVYNNLGEDYIKTRSSLGITKLYLLSQLNEDDRAEIEVSAEDSSVRELEKRIKQLEEEKEKLQCSFFDMEKEKEAAEELAAEFEGKLKAEIEKPNDVAVAEPDPEEVNRLAEQKAEEMTSTARARISELKDQLDSSRREVKEMKSQISKVSVLETKNEELKKKVEELQNSDESENIKKGYELKIEALQKKLDEVNSTHVDVPAGADEDTIFRLKMENFLPVLNGVVNFVENAEKSDELKGKLKGALEKIIARL